jgi:hypothetical protein
MVAALAALVLTVAEPVKLPDLGFDYREMILQHTQAVVDGKGEHALEVMDAARRCLKEWVMGLPAQSGWRPRISSCWACW